MSFFDNINPFKKKDDLGLPPIDSMPHDNTLHDSMPNFGDGLPHDPLGGPAQPNFAAPDPRMSMPLGESIRQARMEAMHGNPNDYMESSSNTYPQSGSQHNPLQKDLELISSKLDYLKASLEAINQRLSNLEHMARNQQDNSRRW